MIEDVSRLSARLDAPLGSRTPALQGDQEHRGGGGAGAFTVTPVGWVLPLLVKFAPFPPNEIQVSGLVTFPLRMKYELSEGGGAAPTEGFGALVSSLSAGVKNEVY